MGRSKNSRKYLSLAIASALLTPAAWAQESAPAGQPSAQATTLDKITVTSRKREETLQEVPIAVTAFTAEALDRMAVEDLSDLDALVPNLTVYAARGSSSTVTAYIRGIGQSDPLWGVDPGVGIYLDDVYIARPQGALLDVFDVQRVEVLRGPQGTLYGKNTIGGAIKYISRGDFDVQFAFDWVDDQSGVRGAQMLGANRFVPGVAPMDSRYDVRNGMPNVNDTQLKGASMTVNWRANDDWAFKYVLAKRESDTETNIDFDTTQAKIADVKAFYSDQQVSHELQANFDAGGRARGVMGLYAFNGDAGGQVLNNFFNLLFGDTQGTVRTESVALYADWTFDLTERLKLDVGARYTDEDKRATVLNRGYRDATFSTPISVVANFDKTINFKNTSPKVSLDYQVSDDIMLYALASRGFKSGGYNIRAQATAVPRSAEPFNDEVVDSFEVGSKMAFLDQTLFLNLAAFHNKYEDIQLSVFTAYDSNGDGTDDAFFGDFTNAGQGTVNGVEVEYQWLPTRNWAISGNLAWLDGKYDEFRYAGLNIADEQEFTNAPEFSGAFNVEYRTELAGGGDLSARIGYSYQSEVVATTEIQRAEVPPHGRAPITQDGYGLLNAGVTWRLNDAWSFSLSGTNLADEEYLTTGYNLNRALGVYTGFYGPPRQYSLTARYNF